MCTMGAVVVIEVLPLGQPLFEINVALVAEELVELLLIRAVRSFDLAVELWGSRLDVDVSNALIHQVPVELRLKLMPSIRSHGVDPERKLLDDVIDEGDGVLLGMAAVDLEGADPGGVVDCLYW